VKALPNPASYWSNGMIWVYASRRYIDRSIRLLGVIEQHTFETEKQVCERAMVHDKDHSAVVIISPGLFDE
jgi:hypothetical protein